MSKKINTRILVHIPIKSNDWRDKDQILQDVILQLLIDFVELEKGCKIISLDEVENADEEAALNKQNAKSRQLLNLYEEAKKYVGKTVLDKTDEYERVTALLNNIVSLRGFLWT